MSLEQHIQALTAAVQALTGVMQAGSTSAAAVVPQAAPAQAPIAAPSFAAPPASMPPGPSFAAPPAAAPVQVPFADPKGLYDYAMAAYQALEAKGPGRGAQIEQVIKSMGHGSLNDVRPDQYGAFFQAAENLKAAP